ncbi:hypothetical protein NDU88_008508 [Pleurodeles waltl]|uniref:Reverse transcriptase domain-containing protein n=1 Tax=Pleurodeles waltl TaxID=8319 RepID=A0AAV7NW94_PLEWA|nr:hypothetical protein NDU88_008508 [Pleurodeles waltl]
MARVRYSPGLECTEPFLMEQGIRQGFVLVPLLFSLLLNDVTDYLLEELLEVPIMAGRTVPVLLFADGAVLIGCTENAAHRLLNRFYCGKISSVINSNKMMSMVMRPSPGFKQKQLIDGVSIETVKYIDYLGIRFVDKLHCSNHVWKTSLVLKQMARVVLKFMFMVGARSKAVATELYVAEL